MKNKTNPPIIGVSMGQMAAKEYAHGHDDLASIPLSYLNAICRAGAVPLGIPNNPEGVDRLLPMVAGLILMGGDDISVERYAKGPPSPKVLPPQPQRDSTEFKLVQLALKRKIPYLGICRGAQVFNVVLGGTLHQHLLDDLPGVRQHAQLLSDDPDTPIFHPVSLEPGSLVARIAGADQMTVNSDHHQGIKKLGRGLTITARSDDGVVEAVELQKMPFALGLQWHPERLAHENPQQAAFFEAFVRAAGGTVEKNRERLPLFRRLRSRP